MRGPDSCLAWNLAAMDEAGKPAGASPVRRIDVIAPSGAVLSRESFDIALARLRGYGHLVRSRVPDAPWLRFSDTDEGRLGQIHDAARARDLDLVMIARGGYGLSRLLDRIDWPLVAESVRRGVRWVGFSDFTAFQLALLAATGADSWAGPAVCSDFGQAEPEPYTLAQFRSLLDGNAPVVEWQREALGRPGCAAQSEQGSEQHGRAQEGREIQGRVQSQPGRGSSQQRRSNEASTGISRPACEAPEGTLWGGNLAMVASLVGTRWLPEVDGGLLFVEDVAEHPYRIERMLLQLLHAGVLPRQRAIVFGAFTDWQPAPHDNGFDVGTVARHLEDRLGIPVIEGLPFGHIRRRAVLGVGRRYRLDGIEAQGGNDRIRLLPL